MQKAIIYHQEVSYIFSWLEDLSTEQVNQVIALLLQSCSLLAKRNLYTILEPLLHRDYIYHKFDTSSSSSFSSVSTYISRELREKNEKEVSRLYTRFLRKSNNYRLKSAHMKNQDDVFKWANESVSKSIRSLSLVDSPTINMPSSCKFFIDCTKKTKKGKNRLTSFNVWAPSSSSDISTETECKSLVSTEELKSKKLPELKPRKATSSHSYLFQSPARSTLLKRSKTPGVSVLNATHGNILKKRKHKDVSMKEDLLNCPLNLTTIKRHMQDTGYCQKGCLQLHDIQKSKSIPALPLIDSSIEDKETRCNDTLVVMLSFTTWSENEQENFLRLFIKTLSSSQLYFFYASLTIRLYCDFLSNLPYSVSVKILWYLTPKQLIDCCKVCKKWKKIACHNDVWTTICRKKNIYVFTNDALGSYIRHKRLKDNWQNGPFAVHQLQKHTGSVTCIHIRQNLLASSSTDKTIRIWNLTQEKCIATLEGHQKSAWSVQFISNNLVCSGSSDQTIKIWNFRKSICLRTIIAHYGAIWSLCVKENLLASGSTDKCVKLWDLKSCGLIHSFSNHSGGVYSVVISDNQNQLYVGTIDRTVYIWDIYSRLVIMTLHVGNQKLKSLPVTSISYHQGFLLCACGSDIYVYELDSYNEIYKIDKAHTDRIECVKLIMLKTPSYKERLELEEELKARIVSAGKDGKVNVWSLQSKKPLHSISLSDLAVNYIQITDEKLFCALQDTSIKIVNFLV